VVIYAHECNKNSKHHFKLTADSLIILVANKAVLLYASDLQSSDRALLEMLRKFLQKNSSITVLHDYKKHLGLLKSLKLFDSNNSFDTPLLDTRLASYLLEPDFRAETLENMAEHYLDIQPDEDNLCENEAKQGELDLL
ncbi:DNA polymerase I, partial [Bifidobacteriaceae bacterium NR021]